MLLENYISDLLYRYQCVVVPDFGAFLTHLRSARIDSHTTTIYPPAKRISFNAQLGSNDGLLAKYIADVEHITYEEALAHIETAVNDWKIALQHRDIVHLHNIGELYYNEDNNILFQPSEHINYLISSFGLTPVVSNTILRETLKKDVEVLETTTPLLFTPEKRRRYPFLRYAAIFLLTISLGTVGYSVLKKERLRQYEVVRQEAQQAVEISIQKATFFNTDPAPLPSIRLHLSKELLRYHVVAGAFRVPSNAEKKIDQLRSKGYPAKNAGINRYGLHIISYGSFSKAEEALSFLKTIRKEETAQAWLWVSQ